MSKIKNCFTSIILLICSGLLVSGCDNSSPEANSQLPNNTTQVINSTLSVVPNLTISIISSITPSVITKTNPVTTKDIIDNTSHRLIQEVENEAKKFSYAPPPSLLGDTFRQNHPGTSERICVNLDSPSIIKASSDKEPPNSTPGITARSGEFVVGFFLSGQKVWFVPLHATEPGGLTVVGTQLDNPSKKFNYKSDPYVRADGAYLTNDVFSTLTGGKGNWLFVATSTTDWGCFVITLPQTLLSH